MLTQQTQLRVARAEANDPHWDAFVREAPDSQICHLSGWCGIIEDVLGREYIPLVAVTPEGEWRGVLPLVRIRAPLLGHSLISVPYLNYGGPIGSPEAQERLTAAALKEARDAGADLLQLRHRSGAGSLNGARKTAVLLDLPDEPDELWRRFTPKLRSQIRRPQKEGMEFRLGPDQRAAFYSVFARNMRDLGTPVYSRRFFERIADAFADEVVFGAVYWKGRPVSAGCGFIWRSEFEITWASSIRDHNPMAPNMLLYWGFMEEMIRRRVGAFNFGRSTPGSSTHRFKQQWGGRDVPLGWRDWHARGRANGSSSSTLAQLASAAWRHLPLGIANRVGPMLAARLPWW